MQSAPLISIVLPARDAASTLAFALASIRRQDERRFECIVVDDGSRDATGTVARTLASADARFRVVSTEPRGIVAALAAGLALCRGRYVARMDADDLMHRTRLARQLARLEADAGLAGVGCHVRFFPRRGLGAGLQRYEQWLGSLRTAHDVWRERFVECPLAHPTLFLRREVIERFGYRDPGWPEDYDLVLRLLEAGQRLSVLPEALHLWRDGPSRLSRTHPAYGLDRFAACRAHFLASDFLRDERRYVLWGYGDTGRVLCRLLAEKGYRPSHIVELHPGRLGQRIAGAPVVRPEALAEIAPSRIVVSVAGAEARALIRRTLGSLGFEEGEQYVCAA